VIAYVDTSVLLRIMLGEPKPLRQWRSVELALCSELIRVEALRTLDRARIALQLGDAELASRRSDMLEALQSFHIVPLGRSVLDRAAEPFPTLLRTLDAIHLATAILARNQYEDLVLATHDRGLATGARAMGLRVIGSPI
jgi:uncharacterized protein